MYYARNQGDGIWDVCKAEEEPICVCASLEDSEAIVLALNSVDWEEDEYDEDEYVGNYHNQAGPDNLAINSGLLVFIFIQSLMFVYMFFFM